MAKFFNILSSDLVKINGMKQMDPCQENSVVSAVCSLSRTTDHTQHWLSAIKLPRTPPDAASQGMEQPGNLVWMF